MFKLKNGLVLVFLFAIALSSCDGRRSSKQALDESIAEFKLKSDIIKALYIPETYTEKRSDTLLSNGYAVSIKTWTDMQSNVEIATSANGITYSSFYRNHKLSIQVKNERHSILNTVLNHQSLKKHLESSDIQVTNMVLSAAYLDEEKSLFNKGIYVKLHFKYPKTNTEKIFDMVIADNGTFKILSNNART